MASSLSSHMGSIETKYRQKSEIPPLPTCLPSYAWLLRFEVAAVSSSLESKHRQESEMPPSRPSIVEADDFYFTTIFTSLYPI